MQRSDNNSKRRTENSEQNAGNPSLDYPQPYNLIGDGPEGPEVRVMAEQLDMALRGLTVIRMEWDARSRYHARPIPGFNLIRNKFPAEIQSVGVKAKRLIFTLQSHLDGTNFYLYSFLAMEGKWVWEPLNHSNLWLVLGEVKPTQPPLHLIQRILYYDDSRHQGQINCFDRAEDLYTQRQKLGPDVLAGALFERGELLDLPESEQLSPERWRAIFRNPRLNQKRLCEFLLDQARVSGIGNYIRAEIMYATQLSPYRLLESLTEAQIEALRLSAMDIMYRSYKAQGHTFSSFVNTHGDKGEFKCVIYRKSHCPLGHPIIQEPDKQKRMVHWVPAVQV